MSKLTHEQKSNIILKYNEILSDTGSILLTTPEDYDKLLHIQCKCGDTFFKDGYQVNSKKHFYCNGKTCKNDKRLAHNTMSDDKIKEKLKTINITEFEIIRNIKGTLIKQTCSCGNIFERNISKLSTLKFPNLCSECARTHQSLKDGTFLKKDNEFKKYIEFKGSKLLSEYKGSQTSIKVKCKECNNTIESTPNYIYQWTDILCDTCKPVGTSKQEIEVSEFVKEKGFNVLTNDRSIIKPKELDIVVNNIAIEFDGIWWHKNNKNQHLNKTELCEEKGYKLLHVFDNEWTFKKDIWQSVILSKLNVTKRIYARKCEIREVNNDEAKKFFETTHLQGNVNASVKIGLYYNDELVSCMSFGKSRFNKNYEWELFRFSNSLGYTIIGGASKLLKYFERLHSPKSLISYANRRWSDGNLYDKLGFKFIRNTEPNYFYFKGSNIESRNKYQKHKLEKLLDDFDSTLSESENMLNNGFNKIYDSGNKVYVKEYL